MYCLNHRTNLMWKDVSGNRYLFCKSCGQYYSLEGKKLVKVNPFVEEYKEKYSGGVTPPVQTSEVSEQIKYPSRKSRGRTGKQKTNLGSKQHEENSSSL